MSDVPATGSRDAASAGAAAFAAYLRARRVIDGGGLYVPGLPDALLGRLRALGAAEPDTVAPERPRDAGPPAGRVSDRHPDGPPVDRSTIDRLATVGTADQIEGLETLETVRAVAEGCVRCPLHETRQNVVFADGSPDARVMCVGEAPGRNEDETGLPFVGRGGNLLDRLLLSVGLPRQDVYICNVLKCRPPQNRNPLPQEIERCSPFLRRQVALVAPEVIVAFGTFAARTLLNASGSLGSLRGRTHRYEGVPLVVTYHPAALLRNPGWKRPAWEDLQRVRHLLEEGPRG